MTTKRLEIWILTGLMAAMTTVGTMLISVAVPGGTGYIHVGDTVVYLCGVLLGPVFGALAAGLGSALSDVLLGWAAYAPATLVIKSVDAFIVGFIYHRLVKSGTSIGKKTLVYIVSVGIGGTAMVGGYFLYDSLLYAKTAFVNLPLNFLQAVGNGLIAYPLVLALGKIKLLKRTENVGPASYK